MSLEKDDRPERRRDIVVLIAPPSGAAGPAAAGGRDIGAVLAREVAALCRGRGLAVVLAPDLHHLPEGSPVWKELAGIDGPLVAITGLHPRPVEWILDRHDVHPPRLTALRIDGFPDAASCFAAIAEALPELRAPEGPGAPGVEGPEPLVLEEPLTLRWYPVVDRSRCTDCRSCLQFCLFGVYGTGPDGRLAVTEPDRCKQGCPACSRICPQGAIIFPLYDRDPAIAGAPGLYKTPDAASRRMFHERTGKEFPGAAPAPAPAPPRPESKAAAAGDDLDRLVTDLEQLMRRRE
jgi:NAD-dependent dihydropyrimidine dehydrogenase PreA subunit